MTGKMTHECAAEGCHVRTSMRMLMCLACWRRVPVELQSAVWKAYRKLDSSGRAQLTPAYTKAVVDAIDAVRVARWKERTSADRAQQLPGLV